MVLFGADVVSLYPSLGTETIAEAIRAEVMESDIKWTNINWDEAGQYISNNTDPADRRQMGVDSLVPSSRYTKGHKPMITGEDILLRGGEGGDPEAKLIFKRRKMTEPD